MDLLAQQNVLEAAITVFVGVGALLFFLLVMVVFLRYLRWWLRAFLAGAPISMLDLVQMTFRKISPGPIVDARILAAQGGLDDEAITIGALQEHYLAGGDVRTVIMGMIEAQRTGKKLAFDEARALELSGKLDSLSLR